MITAALPIIIYNTLKKYTYWSLAKNNKQVKL